MSLLNFPPEITLQVLQKVSLYDRINLCRTHPRLLPLCFDRLLDRNSAATISLKELRQLYQQSRTEEERDQCFNPKILDRLRTNNFNELVHMNMDPENHKFLANHKILHSFKGKIVLESENEKFSEDFYEKFLSLIDNMKGNLLLIFVDVKEYGNDYAELCAQTLSRKMKRGEKVFLMETKSYDDDPESKIDECLKNKCIFFSITGENSQHRTQELDSELYYFLKIPKTISGVNIETMIAMMNEDRFAAAKQLLVSVLPLVKAAELRGGGRNIGCNNCYALEGSLDDGSDSDDSEDDALDDGSDSDDSEDDDGMMLLVNEPAWSNCVGCIVK